MVCEKTQYEVLKSKYQKRFRILRATIIRGKKMRQMQPAEMRQLQEVVYQGGVDICNSDALTKKHARLLRMLSNRVKKMKWLTPDTDMWSDRNPHPAPTMAMTNTDMWRDRNPHPAPTMAMTNTDMCSDRDPHPAPTMAMAKCDFCNGYREGGCSYSNTSCHEVVAEYIHHQEINMSYTGVQDVEDCEMQNEPCTDNSLSDQRTRMFDIARDSFNDHSTQVASTMTINECDSHNRSIVRGINTFCQEVKAKDISHAVITKSYTKVDEPKTDKKTECLADKRRRLRMSETAKESCADHSTQVPYTMVINEGDCDKGDCSGINTSCHEMVVKDICLKVSKESCIGVEEEEDRDMEHEAEAGKEDEGLDEIWKEMAFALESCKETPKNPISDEPKRRDDDNCDHSFILKDDIGSVCRVCGLIEKGMEHIFEFYYPKRMAARYYRSESRKIEDSKPDETLPDWSNLPKVDPTLTELLANGKHLKQMKPHQREGFNFLIRNLMTEVPHGCILAHAPGSGKTFMLICFLQSFLDKYPFARPLVVLPKGILGTWKKEFQRWQVEEISLYDFYSVKASSRPQQLAVLKQWVDQKSILFLGYKQFSSIVTGTANSKDMYACQEILVQAPTVLILDEGHTPRNEGTDTLSALVRVRTPRKVVLSGTLYQNHVKEVFNILNLVQPRFLKLDANRTIAKRIMSKVQIHGVRKQLSGSRSGNAAFFDLLENTLLNDKNYQRKIGVIKDLREMTNPVLHYYKGDSFDELPGLIDFTVILRLSPKQREEVDKLKKMKERKFRISSIGSATYIHPQLKHFSVSSDERKQASGFVSDEKLDHIIEAMNLKDGAKAKFFLDMLRLCESTQEKLLVFSHYLLPLRFLERLAVYYKGWTQTKEIFVITGESTPESREWSMEQFNNSPDARVFFGSVKACGEGISLVGASRILILDVHPNPSVSWQAICRAFRPGQKKKVYTYRLVAADSPEEEDHLTCFRKEVVAKMWFEWNEFSGQKSFDCKAVDLEECGDAFLQSSILANDVKTLYRRNNSSCK